MMGLSLPNISHFSMKFVLIPTETFCRQTKNDHQLQLQIFPEREKAKASSIIINHESIEIK
ncbi:MAG: hypothetical protein ACJ72Q_05975, partial [Nitrososphaeraceae archaeon]